MNAIVLLLTRSDDNACVPAVIEALRRRGAEPVRFDTDRFPTEVRLSACYDGADGRFELITPAGVVDLMQVRAVWRRRLSFGRGIPAGMEAQRRDACVQESRASALGVIEALPAFHLDPEDLVRRAAHKPLQLRLAREAGLEIPRTLITNDPRELRAFARACPDGVVAKMLSSFAIREDGREKVVFTTPVAPSDLESATGLELSPMTFQERVPKVLELRVTVVGERVMAAAVDPGAIAGAGEDWRREGRALLDAWRPHPLPPGLEDALRRLMDALGLHYGAMDLILTPAGRWVFLEVNPVGEFFWLDRLFSPSISEALADTLLGLAARRDALQPAACGAREG